MTRMRLRMSPWLRSDPDTLPDRVSSLYAQLPASLLGQALAIVVSGLLFLVHADPTLRGAALGWLVVVTLSWGWRWRLSRVYAAQPAPQVADWSAWCCRWEVSTLLCAGAWALAMFWLYPLGNDLQRAGLFALLACLGIGSAAAGHVTTLIGFGVMAAALVWQFFATSGREGTAAWIDTLGVIGVSVGVALVGHHQRQSYTRLLTFKRRSELLAAQLAAEKDIAEEARLAAEAATRARTEFFTAASHDLRQPLHALVLFTESLRLRNRDPGLQPGIARIGESVDALEALFDKLLDLTSIDSGAIVVEPRLFHMRELYARLKVHFEPVAFDKGLALDFVGGRHAVRADPLLVERILRNLVSNAIRYTEDGGVLVSSRTRSGQLLVQVWDTGIGIDERLLPTIFDEFYQISASRAPDESPRKGLGLGLAIVKRLAELLPAPLTVRSRPGHGTVFSLWLPLADEPVPEEVVPGLTWSSPTLQGRHVVVVGAEPDLGVQGPGAMLQGWGAQVSRFGHAAQVLDWAASQARLPDLVVIGETPAHERGGVELVRALRQVFGAVVPAVVLVGDGAASAEGDPAGVTEPGVHLLARPVAPNRLRAMVNFKLSTRTISHPDL